MTSNQVLPSADCRVIIIPKLRFSGINMLSQPLQKQTYCCKCYLIISCSLLLIEYPERMIHKSWLQFRCTETLLLVHTHAFLAWNSPVWTQHEPRILGQKKCYNSLSCDSKCQSQSKCLMKCFTQTSVELRRYKVDL